MSRAFENAPNGLNYDVYGGAVPNSMLYRIKQIEGLSKQTLKPLFQHLDKVPYIMEIKLLFPFL